MMPAPESGPRLGHRGDYTMPRRSFLRWVWLIPGLFQTGTHTAGQIQAQPRKRVQGLSLGSLRSPSKLPFLHMTCSQLNLPQRGEMWGHNGRGKRNRMSWEIQSPWELRHSEARPGRFSACSRRPLAWLQHELKKESRFLPSFCESPCLW